MKLALSLRWMMLSLSADGILGASAESSRCDATVTKEDLASVPMDSLVDLPGGQAVVGLDDLPAKPSPRHEEEKKRLLTRMSKSHGNWDTNHPRSRLLDALFAFSRYKERNMAELERWRGLYQHVSRKQQHVLERAVGYTKKIETVEQLIELNAQLCGEIVDAALEFYEIERKELDGHIKASEDAGRTADRISVSQALKHYVRDWSAGGRVEREDAFPCIVATLQALFPDRSEGDVKALLPGAGLGRLGHEVASLGGFEVTNNEWSMYMNVAYRFLEAHRAAGSKAAHPFIDGWSHHATTANMLRGVTFPDATVNASAVLLVEGDFTTVFSGQEGKFDVVVTHFFIDTARNLMNYLDTISGLLRPGGYWVNFGPLLYGTGPWVQLSLGEVIAVAKAVGFEFVATPAGQCGDITLEGELVRGRHAVYGFDEKALTMSAYSAQSWAARKKE